VVKTDLTTALNSIDSCTVGGCVVIKAVINEVQVPCSHAYFVASSTAQHSTKQHSTAQDSLLVCMCQSHV